MFEQLAAILFWSGFLTAFLFVLLFHSLGFTRKTNLITCVAAFILGWSAMIVAVSLLGYESEWIYTRAGIGGGAVILLFGLVFTFSSPRK